MFLVTGGYDGFGTLDSTEIYDPDLGSWNVAAALPGPLSSHKSVTTNNRILLVGIDILLRRLTKNC